MFTILFLKSAKIINNDFVCNSNEKVNIMIWGIKKATFYTGGINFSKIYAREKYIFFLCRQKLA
jgi:hypothetical protein